MPLNQDSSHPDEGPRDHQGSKIEDLEGIFAQVVDAPRDRRDALLRALCQDEALRQRVRLMLDADSASDPLLDHSLIPERADGQIAESISGYKLLHELGQGGMGVVYKAEQLEPVQRTVALKVIKPGVDTREVLARFDAERQALSMMEHPNIAKALEAGTTDNGRPFFVMELVNGQPITTYCEQKTLSVKERLELFIPVCHAIQHAHQKGIIHRDIKPSNVLVAEYDTGSIAKVIDFGVAKAINQPVDRATAYTRIGQIIGTFEYMSPEQSRVNQMDVDTRSDIYSLGVLLYELLTGCPPFETARLRSAAWDEMLRIIREEDPPKPSTRILERSTAKSHDGRQSYKPSNLIRFVRGELDWIVMKSMEKDRNLRYTTPAEFANDIQCFLNGDAVAACPPSPMYRFTKFAKRNRAALATSAIVAASLVVGLIGTTRQAIRASRAEAKTAASEAETQEINDFLENNLLSLAGVESEMPAGFRPDPNLTLLKLLKNAADEVETRFADRPQIKANLQATLANSFKGIGQYEDATRLYEEYLEFLRANKAPQDPDTIRVMRQLARNYINESRLDDAENLVEEALAYSRSQLSDDHEVTLLLQSDVATLHQKQERYHQAEKAYLQCLRDSRRLFGDKDPKTLVIKSNLAVIYESLARFDEAEQLQREVLQAYRETLESPSDVRIVASLNSLGSCYLKSARYLVASQPQNGMQRDRFEMAAKQLKDGWDISKTERGPNNPDTLEIQSKLTQAYLELGEFDRAEPILKDLVSRQERSQNFDDLAVLETANMLGWTYLHQSRFDEAENILTETYDRLRQSHPNDPRTLQVMSNLAIVCNRMGKLDESIRLDHATLDLAETLHGSDHVEVLKSRARLGLSYREKGRTAEGRQQLEQAIELGKNRPEATLIAGLLATSFVDDDSHDADTQEALHWTAKQLEIGQRFLKSDSLEFADLLAECGSRQLKLKAWNEAEDNLQACVAIRAKQAPESVETFDAKIMLVEAYTQQNNNKAAELLLVDTFHELIERAADVRTKHEARPLLHSLLDRLVAFYEGQQDMEQARQWQIAAEELKQTP